MIHNRDMTKLLKPKEQNKNYAKTIQSPKTHATISSEQESRTYIPTPSFPKKEIHINIPLALKLKQMANYVKLLKGVLKNRRKLEELKVVALNEE